MNYPKQINGVLKDGSDDCLDLDVVIHYDPEFYDMFKLTYLNGNISPNELSSPQFNDILSQIERIHKS